jgi:Tol biopolymer transport system component
MNADGTGKKDISEHGAGEWRMPEWSNDGEKILYSRFIEEIDAPELFLMDTSGQN